MAVTDKDKVKDHTQLASSQAAEKVASFADQAEVRLRVLIGDAKYQAIAGDENHDDLAILTRAESYMCMYYGLQFLNLRPTDLGGLTKMVGYGESATEMLMGERELRAIRGRMYEMAVELVDQIRDVVPEDPEDFNDVDIDSFDAGTFSIA